MGDYEEYQVYEDVNGNVQPISTMSLKDLTEKTSKYLRVDWLNNAFLQLNNKAYLLAFITVTRNNYYISGDKIILTKGWNE